MNTDPAHDRRTHSTDDAASAEGHHEHQEPLTFVNWSQVVRAAILLLWALYFLLLVLGGSLRYYINPIYALLPCLGVVALVAMVWTGRRRWRTVHVHDDACREGYEPCAYRHRFRFGLLKPMAIFMVPLMFGLLIPPAALNALILEKKGLNLRPVDATPALVAQRASATSQPSHPVPLGLNKVQGGAVLGENLGMLVSTLGILKLPKHRAKYPLPPNAGFLSHFVMTCCAADATTASAVLLPLEGMAVTSKPDPDDPTETIRVVVLPDGTEVADQQWASVEGWVTLVDWGPGKLMTAIQVRALAPCKEPENPFLYR